MNRLDFFGIKYADYTPTLKMGVSFETIFDLILGFFNNDHRWQRLYEGRTP
jgi:hypothetical protein